MTTRLLQFYSCGLLAVSVMIGCTQTPPPVAKNGDKKGISVKPVTVTQQQIQRTTSQPATVHAYYEAEIRAKTGGYVKEVRADIGDYVEAGAPLAIIDVPEMEKQRQVLEARIIRYQSEVKRARAGVELAKANVQSAQAKAAQARSEMSSVEASVAAAEAEFDRTQDLVQRQSLESRVLDEVRKRRDSERARAEAVNSSIRSAEADVTVAEAKATSAEADVEAAQAETAIAQRELEKLDVLLDYATLKAPFAGIVSHRAVDPGDLVRESSEVGKGEPLFVVSQVDKVRVRIPLPEVDAAMINPGDQVSLTFPSFPAEEPVVAEVTRSSGSLDPSTRTMIVEADIDNPQGKLIPGMFGQATVTSSTQAVANMLPARAIRFGENGDAHVYVVDSNDTVSVVAITTGVDNGHSIEVKSGLESGQTVVDAHLQRFSDGQKVVVLEN